MKQFIKEIMPPFILNYLSRLLKSKYGWHGEYDSWKNALDDSAGYDSENILAKVRASALKVKNGEAAYERDSVLFFKPDYSVPVLATLMLSLAKSNRISVLDFGGSLGNAYFQTKTFLDELKDVTWSVVEQAHFVDIGNSEFKNDRLKFYHSISECASKEKPNVLLLSSVLQYLEKPYEMLDEMLELNFDFILIDRTPISLVNRNVIKLQKVPPSIYKASYPCWFLNELDLIDKFAERRYKLVEEFETSEGQTGKCVFKGMILKKND